MTETITDTRGVELRSAQGPDGWPMLVARRCPGNHESVPWVDVSTVHCAACGRELAARTVV